MSSIDQALLASLDLVFAQDVEGRFLYVSSVTARAFRSPRDRLIGQTLDQIDLPPVARRQLQAHHREIVASGQALSGEIQFPAFYPGQLKDYEYTLSPVLGRDGRIEAIVFIGKDITQRKRAEIALQESEKKYRLLFEAANDAIFIVDCQSRRILNANWSAARRLGYPRRELLNLALDTIELPLEPGGYADLMEQLEIEGNIIYEHCYRRKDGVEIPVEVNAQLIEYEEHLAIQYFVRDISQRKQAEETLRQQQIYQVELYQQLQVELQERRRVEAEIRVLNGELEQRVQQRTEQLRQTNLELAEEVAERLRAEVALRKINRRYEALASLSPVGIFQTSALGECIYGNQRCYEILGCLRIDPLPCPITAQLHPSDRPQVLQTWQQALEQATPYQVECRYLHPSGETIWTITQGQPEFDDDGHLLGFVNTITDVTELKRVEEEARTSQALLRTLIDALPFGVWARDAETRLILQNPVDIQRFGHKLGTCLQDLQASPDVTQRHQEFRENCLANNQTLEYEAVEPCQGEDRHVLRIISPFPQADGRLGSLGVVIDITERKRAEVALRDSEARFRTVFENAGFGIVVVEPPHYDFHYSNPAFQSLIGYRSQELASLTLADLTHPEDLPGEWVLMEACLSGQCDRYQLEKRYCHKTGSVVWVNFMFTLVRDESGGIQFGIGLVEDITTRKLNEAAHRQAELALQQSEAQQRAILEAIPDSLFWVRTDGILVKAIRTEQSFSRLPPDLQPEGKHLSEALPEEIAHLELAAMERALTTGRLVVLEHQVEQGDRVQYQEVRVVPTGSDGALIMVRDVSDRKRAEIQLQEMKDRYELAVTGIGEVLWDWDIMQDRAYISPRFQEMVGFSNDVRDLCSSKDFYGWIHPEDREAVKQAIQRHLEQREPFNIEYRMRHHSGTYIWVRNRSQALWNEAGQPIRMIGTCYDITEFKRLGEALRQSEASYRAIVELQTELVCRFRPDCTLTFANDAYCQYFQISPEAISEYNWLDFLPLDLQPYVRRYLASLGVENPIGSYEHEVITPAGEVRWHAWSDRALCDVEGQVVEYQSVGRDITDRKNLELALEQAQAALHDVLEHASAAIVQLRFRDYDVDAVTVDYVSAACADIFGFTPEEVRNQPSLWRSRIDPEDMEKRILPFWQRLLENHKERVVYRFHRADGQTRWIEANAIARYDSLQKAWVMTAIETDVTARYTQNPSED